MASKKDLYATRRALWAEIFALGRELSFARAEQIGNALISYENAIGLTPRRLRPSGKARVAKPK